MAGWWGSLHIRLTSRPLNPKHAPHPKSRNTKFRERGRPDPPPPRPSSPPQLTGPSYADMNIFSSAFARALSRQPPSPQLICRFTSSLSTAEKDGADIISGNADTETNTTLGRRGEEKSGFGGGDGASGMVDGEKKSMRSLEGGLPEDGVGRSGLLSCYGMTVGLLTV